MYCGSLMATAPAVIGKILWNLKSTLASIVKVNVAVMEPQDQYQFVEERVYLVYISTLQSTFEEVRTGTQSGQEPGGRN